MAGRALPALRLPHLLVAAALPLAVLLGGAIALSPKRGIGLTIAMVVVPLVLRDLRIALGLYAGIIAVEHLPFVSIGPNATGVALLVAWVGTAQLRARSGAPPLTQRHKLLVASVLGLLLWTALSTTWADDQGRAGAALFEIVLGVLMFFVYATGITSERSLVTVVSGLLIGAVVSVTIGLIGSGMASPGNAIHTATQFEGRLSGGSGDPNYLAAGLVPAMALAGGLLALVRGALSRMLLIVAIAVCAVGLAASQSRGGIIALAAAAIAALVVARGHRLHVVAVLCVLLSVAGGWLAANPAALSRVVSANDGGDGRSELWTVAWDMFNDHPVIGVGLNNYVRFSRDYAQTPGERKFGELLTEKPVLVHNAYLQLLAETGVIGLALLLTLIGAAIRAAWLAAERFARAGRAGLATLARTLIVAQVGALSASFFLSNVSDKRTWLLLALGPAMLGLAGRAGERAVTA